jgi:hypothetical protein
MADLTSGAANSMVNSAANSAAPSGGGERARAMLKVTEGRFSDLVFEYNPETISVEKAVDYREHRTQSTDSGQLEYTSGFSRSLKVSQVYFDTYETRENVRTKYIDTLEALTQNDPGLGQNGSPGRPPKVLFVWGNFMAQNDPYNSCKWFVKRVSVQYVMFLGDGTPVRAKIDFDLIEATSVEDELQNRSKSGNDASVVRTQGGDSLQSLAQQHYGDPGQWRRIADANGIDDPSAVPPGSTLVIPRSKA